MSVNLLLATDPRDDYPDLDFLEEELGALYERLAAVVSIASPHETLHDERGVLTLLGREFAVVIADYHPIVQAAYWFACHRELAKLCGVEGVTLRLIYTR